MEGKVFGNRVALISRDINEIPFKCTRESAVCEMREMTDGRRDKDDGKERCLRSERERERNILIQMRTVDVTL